MAWMKGYLTALVAQLVKNPACNAGDPGLIPGSGRSPGEGIDYPLQYSGLETDKELCLREALAVCTPPAPEPSAKRPGS